MSSPQYQGQPPAYAPSGYPSQPQPQAAYPQGSYPQTSYPQPPYPPAPAGYPAQAAVGSAAQAAVGYPAQAPVGYPAQAPAGYPAQPPAGYAPGPGYPTPPVPGDGYQVPAQSHPRGTTQCRLCGCVPAVDVTFREHQGMIILMRFVRLRGPFCRDCGLATFRRMTANTLIRGWYGYASSIITPITVLINLIRRNKVANLPAPAPPPSGPSRHPLDPGAPLMARPVALIGIAIPVLVILLIVLVASIG